MHPSRSLGYHRPTSDGIRCNVHNLSDEMALVALYLAFILSQGVSRNLLRTANVFNSVGLVAVSGFFLWQSVERLLHPVSFLPPRAIVARTNARPTD
jgi:Co/Zn/Cd efflux system component